MRAEYLCSMKPNHHSIEPINTSLNRAVTGIHHWSPVGQKFPACKNKLSRFLLIMKFWYSQRVLSNIRFENYSLYTYVVWATNPLIVLSEIVSSKKPMVLCETISLANSLIKPSIDRTIGVVLYFERHTGPTTRSSEVLKGIWRTILNIFCTRTP